MEEQSSEFHHHHHRHGGGSPKSAGGGRAQAEGSRRESERGSGGETRSGSAHRHHHHSSMHPSRRSSMASSVCVAFAFLSIVVLAMMTLIAKSLEAPPNQFFNGVALGLAGIGFICGFYSQIVQIRYWERRIRNRLLVGIPIALVAMLICGSNIYKKLYAVAEEPGPDGDAPGAPAALSTNAVARLAPEDSSLFKPGWFGEGSLEGVVATINSYAENASESRQFNRRLIREKAAYAVLSVINLGDRPATVPNFQVNVYERDGTVTRSLNAREMLGRNSAANGDMLALLVAPRTLLPRAMLANIPIAMPEGFAWDDVISVALPLESKDIEIRGRMMTAAEREALATRADADGPQAAAPAANTPPAKYYDNL